MCPLLEREKTAASFSLLENRQVTQPRKESPFAIKQTKQPTQLRQELHPWTKSSAFWGAGEVLHPKTQLCPTCCPSLICRVMWEWLENKKAHTQGGKKGGEKKVGEKGKKAKSSGGIVSHPCRATLSRGIAEGLLGNQALEPRKAENSQEILVHTPRSPWEESNGSLQEILHESGALGAPLEEQKPNPSLTPGCGVKLINEPNAASLNGSAVVVKLCSALINVRQRLVYTSRNPGIIKATHLPLCLNNAVFPTAWVKKWRWNADSRVTLLCLEPPATACESKAGG